MVQPEPHLFATFIDSYQRDLLMGYSLEDGILYKHKSAGMRAMGVVTGGVMLAVSLSIVLYFLNALPVAANPPRSQWGGNSEVTFYLDFEKGPYAWKARGNPYQVGQKFELVEDGGEGQSWRNTAKDGYIAFDGLENVPSGAGTVSIWVKADKHNIFKDGKRHCFVSLPRSIEGMVAAKDRWGREGLALSLRKTERNTLDLIAHVGGDSWMRGSRSTPVISTDVAGLDDKKWHHLVFSWDFATRRLWLAIDGKAREAAIPAAILKPHKYLAVVFGNTEQYDLAAQEPVDSLMDEIAILNVPYHRALQIFSTKKPHVGPRPQAPVHRAQAVLFPNDANLARCEQVARAHLNMLVDTQRHGGWALAVKWPSHLQYTAQFRLPEPRSLIYSSKDMHTAFAAAQLLWAYQCLGDTKYLQAAKKTADMYLATQNPADGYWISSYYYENGDYIPGETVALIQDRCQSGPLFLLAYMYHVTRDARYLQAAMKNADFLMRVQNPNGSWPHHYDPVRKAGVSTTGGVGSGEVNDYGTSNSIETLLAMAHLTGQTKYREAALRGADWLVATFIENGKVAGWAGQYNDRNQPLAARHHEPVAVTQLGSRWAAQGLLAAYRETQNEKYLVPLHKALAWSSTQQKRNRLWWDYDIATGRPIAMWRRQVYFLDDPKQVHEYKKVTGGKALIHGDLVGLSALSREVQNARDQSQTKISQQPNRTALQKYVAATAPHYVKSYIEGGNPPLNPEAGLYTFSSTAGLSTSLVRHQVVRFCDLLMRARAARGDIPVDNPIFRHVEASVGWGKVLPALMP